MKERITILVVEDEAITAMIIKKELTIAGYLVSGIVATGEDAVDNVKQRQPDVITMDINLAGQIDGIEAARQILELYRIPIIFLTGYEDKDIFERVNKLNPAAYLIKPAKIQDITAAINSALNV